MKKIFAITLIAITFFCFAGKSYCDVTISFDAADMPDAGDYPLPPHYSFEVDVLVTSTTPLRAIALAFRTDPIGVINVENITPLFANDPGSNQLMKYSNITNRMVLFNNSGIAFNNTPIATIEFQVPERNYTAETANLIVNVLQAIETGDATLTPVRHTVNIENIEVLYQPYVGDDDDDDDITPTPTPTPTGPGGGSTAKYTVFGSCGTISESGEDRIPYELLLMIVPLLIILFIKRKLLILPAVIIALSLGLTPYKNVYSEVYYVDNTDGNCSDGAYSGTDTIPFCTITRALNEVLIPGDTIEVKSGTYTEGMLILDRFQSGQGILAVPITLKASTPGSATINGGTTPAIGIITFTSHWAIENFDFNGGGDWDESYERPGDPPFDPYPIIVGGEEVGTGIIVRNNTFRGTVDGSQHRKNALKINSSINFQTRFHGHIVENNTFENMSFSSGGGVGYSFISVVNSPYTSVRGNTLIHSGASSEAPLKHISVQDSYSNIIERNFSAGNFESSTGGYYFTHETANISASGQSDGVIIRNNILYANTDFSTGDDNMSAILLAGNSNSWDTKDFVHNNSIDITTNGDAGDRFNGVAGHYNSVSAVDFVNNIVVGGDYVINGPYRYYNDEHWPNSWAHPYSDGNFGSDIPFARMDYNDYYNTATPADYPHSPTFWTDTVEDEYRRYFRCYMGWWYDYITVNDWTECEVADTGNTTNLLDSTNPYGGGGTVWNDTHYTTLTGGSTAITGPWSTETRCTDVDGDTIACDGVAGAMGGANPYGDDTTFSFCGDVFPSPTSNPDRMLDMRDVITLWGSDNALAERVADYYATLTLENPADPDEGHLLPSCFD